MTFFQVLNSLCRDRGLSVSNACEQAGISRTQVSRWRNQGTMPTNQALLKLCAFFDVPDDYFDSVLSPQMSAPAYTAYDIKAINAVISLLQTLAEYPQILDMIRVLEADGFAEVNELMRYAREITDADI